jgi:signal transduction histidine kinase
MESSMTTRLRPDVRGASTNRIRTGRAVRATTTMDGATGGWVVVTVGDTGVGIPTEDVKKVFEPLFTTKAKSIGLDLAISKGLVENNRGTIDLQRSWNKG